MRRPHGSHVLGASPQIPFTDDLTARQGDLICPQDQLLDLRMVQSWYRSGALKGGLWLPDWAYLAQDSSGTAVTTTGQVTGYWLDCSKEVYLNNSPAWPFSYYIENINGSSATVSSNVITVTTLSGNASYPRVYCYSNFSLNTFYYIEVNVTVTAGALNGIRLGVAYGTGTYLTKINDSLYRGFLLSAASGTVAVQFLVDGTQYSSVTVNSCIVREIIGNHATQTTTANKPLSALTPVTRKPWLTADSTDVLPVVFPTSLGSACTIARATPTGVTFTESQTISATWNGLIQPYQYNSAVLVADRQLTAREKAIVARVLGAYVPALGNELASNGKFDTDLAGWTLYNTDANNTVTYESGRVHAISDGSKAVGFGQATAKVGNIYYVTFSYEHVSGSGFRFENPDTAPPFTGTSSKDVILCIVSNNLNFRVFRVASGQASNGYFDNMSFRQVL